MKRYTYFIDGKRRSTKRASLLGIEIRALESASIASYSIYLESGDEEPDRLVRDNDTVRFTKHQCRLYTVPPCGGG